MNGNHAVAVVGNNNVITPIAAINKATRLASIVVYVATAWAIKGAAYAHCVDAEGHSIELAGLSLLFMAGVVKGEH